MDRTSILPACPATLALQPPTRQPRLTEATALISLLCREGSSLLPLRLDTAVSYLNPQGD